MTHLIIIILVIIGGLILFAGQNLSPSIALTFLGFQSSALPLSVWILIAIAGGFFSAIVISSLFQLSQSLAEPNPKSSSRQPQPSPSSRVEVDQENDFEFDQPKTRQWQEYPSPASEPVKPQQSVPTTSLAADWETEVQPLNPTWDGQPQTVQSSERFNLEKEDIEPANTDTIDDFEDEGEDWIEDEPENQAERTYEVEQTPQTESWSGSVYSYGYRDQGESGVGKSESVYDADYRVIVPPPATQIQSDEDSSVKADETEDTLNSGQS